MDEVDTRGCLIISAVLLTLVVGPLLLLHFAGPLPGLLAAVAALPLWYLFRPQPSRIIAHFFVFLVGLAALLQVAFICLMSWLKHR